MTNFVTATINSKMECVVLRIQTKMNVTSIYRDHSMKAYAVNFHICMSNMNKSIMLTSKLQLTLWTYWVEWDRTSESKTNLFFLSSAFYMIRCYRLKSHLPFAIRVFCMVEIMRKSNYLNSQSTQFLHDQQTIEKANIIKETFDTHMAEFEDDSWARYASRMYLGYRSSWFVTFIFLVCCLTSLIAEYQAVQLLQLLETNGKENGEKVQQLCADVAAAAVKPIVQQGQEHSGPTQSKLEFVYQVMFAMYHPDLNLICSGHDVIFKQFKPMKDDMQQVFKTFAHDGK